MSHRGHTIYIWKVPNIYSVPSFFQEKHLSTSMVEKWNFLINITQNDQKRGFWEVFQKSHTNFHVLHISPVFHLCCKNSVFGASHGKNAYLLPYCYISLLKVSRRRGEVIFSWKCYCFEVTILGLLMYTQGLTV